MEYILFLSFILQIYHEIGASRSKNNKYSKSRLALSFFKPPLPIVLLVCREQTLDVESMTMELKYALMVESELLWNCEFKLVDNLPLVKDSCSKRHIVCGNVSEPPIEGADTVNDSLEPESNK